MRTLLVTEAPFRDLTYRACTLQARESVPHEGPMLLATPAERVPPGFAPMPPDTVPDGVEQVVLAGPFLVRHRLERALATAAEAVAAGARLLVHNLGLEDGAARIEPPAGVSVMDGAEPLLLRDHRTANVLTLWRVAAPMRILGYPERHVAPDPFLARGLPDGPVLGIAFRGGEEMRKSWQPRLPAITRLLARARGWHALPLPTRLPGTGDEDGPATRAILSAALPGAAPLLPELEDPEAWRRLLGPARLKALVARCALVVTNRDLVAAYAVAAGVPVIGVALGADRRIVSCLATLANELPPGSALVHPAPG
ncbi:hypothetical protein [Falsiroseomonas sp. HW251]|uniref:hypothetical protein n=1 Tax=Falsiroseomonas sp. HW251 TaxID=3390998 RepID=UPI003D319AFF